VLLLALTLLLLVALLVPLWLPWIGMFLVVADPLQKADALILLAGDENERVEAGAQLFQQGYARCLILTDIRLKHPEWQGEYINTVHRMALEQGVPPERILIVPDPVATTYEEAHILKEFTAIHGFNSLLVVTSPYHTRRARWILRQAFQDSSVILNFRPTLNHPYRAQAWWQTPEDRRETFLEYVKMLAHILGCREYDDCSLPRRMLLQH
jgi:uncharacterized SAM-binding protein YcdF (DUF218 family)